MPELQVGTNPMSPLHLFLQADVVVQSVMLGLLLASMAQIDQDRTG